MKTTKTRILTKKNLERRLWALCRELIINKYGKICYTCGQTNLEKGNLQVGHFIPRSTCGAFLKYDLRNLRPQCARCNVFLGGQGAEFYRNMLLREGQKYIDDLFHDKQRITKAEDHWLKQLQKYQTLCD